VCLGYGQRTRIIDCQLVASKGHTFQHRGGK